MNGKTIAVLGALILSAGAMQAQQPTTRPADSTSALNRPGAGKTTVSPSGSALDINTASRAELAAAGWGDYSDAIIAGRPYKSMNDLLDKRVVPPAAYDQGSAKFQVGNGSVTPLTDPKASPMPSTTPTTPPTIGPGTTTTPGAPGTYPTTPAAPQPSGTGTPAPSGTATPAPSGTAAPAPSGTAAPAPSGTAAPGK